MSVVQLFVILVDRHTRSIVTQTALLEKCLANVEATADAVVEIHVVGQDGYNLVPATPGFEARWLGNAPVPDPGPRTLGDTAPIIREVVATHAVISADGHEHATTIVSFLADAATVEADLGHFGPVVEIAVPEADTVHAVRADVQRGVPVEPDTDAAAAMLALMMLTPHLRNLGLKMARPRTTDGVVPPGMPEEEFFIRALGAEVTSRLAPAMMSYLAATDETRSILDTMHARDLGRAISYRNPYVLTTAESAFNLGRATQVTTLAKPVAAVRGRGFTESDLAANLILPVGHSVTVHAETSVVSMRRALHEAVTRKIRLFQHEYRRSNLTCYRMEPLDADRVQADHKLALRPTAAVALTWNKQVIVAVLREQGPMTSAWMCCTHSHLGNRSMIRHSMVAFEDVLALAHRTEDILRQTGVAVRPSTIGKTEQ